MERLRLVGQYLKKSPILTVGQSKKVVISAQSFRVPSVGVKTNDINDGNTRVSNASHYKPDTTLKSVHTEYIKALQLPYLARLGIRDNAYDHKTARNFTKALRQTMKKKNSDQTIFSLSSEQIAKLISVLLQINVTETSPTAKKRVYPKECFTEVPMMTSEITSDIKKFEEYIGCLTHTTFHYRGSSSQSGIISKLLRNLLHPSNLQTMHLKSTSVFNNVIHFFAMKNDFATCRELYAQMKSEGIPVVTETYNLLLKNLLLNGRLVKQKLPYDEAIFYLQRMQKEGVSADVITWNTCYSLLKDNISRSIFLEKMVEKNVPMTYHLIYRILQSDDISFEMAVQFLHENQIPMDTRLIQLCHKKLVENSRYEESWKLIKYAEGLGFKIGGSSFMDHYLRSFAEKGRLDMAIMTRNTFKQQFGVKPSLHSYDMLFKCLVRQGYHNNFALVYGMLTEDLKELTGGQVIVSYWISKCRAILKFNLRSVPVTHASITTFQKEVSRLTWNKEMGMRWNCWLHYYQNRKLFRTLGSIPQVRSSANSSNFDEKKAKRKRKYLKRQKETAISNKKSKQSCYNEDYYGSLRSELFNRGIIQEPAVPKS